MSNAPPWLVHHFHEASPERPWPLLVPAESHGAVGDVVDVATTAQPSEARQYRIVGRGQATEAHALVMLVPVDDIRITAAPLQTRVAAVAGLPFEVSPPTES